MRHQKHRGIRSSFHNMQFFPCVHRQISQQFSSRTMSPLLHSTMVKAFLSPDSNLTENVWGKKSGSIKTRRRVEQEWETSDFLGPQMCWSHSSAIAIYCNTSNCSNYTSLQKQHNFITQSDHFNIPSTTSHNHNVPATTRVPSITE